MRFAVYLLSITAFVAICASCLFFISCATIHHPTIECAQDIDCPRGMICLEFRAICEDPPKRGELGHCGVCAGNASENGD